MPPGQQKGHQNPARSGEVLLQHKSAEGQHNGLPKQIKPELLGNQLAQAEMGHQAAAHAEQRHVEPVNGDEGCTDQVGPQAVLFHEMAKHNQQDAQPFENVDVIPTCGSCLWFRHKKNLLYQKMRATREPAQR